MEEESSDKLEYEFNLEQLQKGNMSTMHQEGNYLVITTDTGITFRHRIPNDKILNKVNDKYVLEDMAL